MRASALFAQHMRQKYSLVDFHAFLVALQSACIVGNLVSAWHQTWKGIGRGPDQSLDPEKPGIILGKPLVDGSHMPRQEALPRGARFLSDGFGGFCLFLVAGWPGRQVSKKLACKLPVGHVAAANAGKIAPSKISCRNRFSTLPRLEDIGRQQAKRKHLRLHVSP